MKLSSKFKLCLLFVLGLLQQMNAQVPQKFSYQAVIRNSSNAILSNQAIGLRVRILQGSSTGSIVYAETHTPTTNSNGLVSIEVGGGTVLNGNFTSINWASGSYYLRTDIDPGGGTSYSITSNAQLLSVPFALFAGNATSSNTILNGVINPTAGQGVNGDFYLNTTTNILYGPKASGVWPATGISLIGPNGSNGNTILNGTSNPATGQGVNGDFFLNTSTNTLFGPKVSGVWPSTGTSMVGPQGPSGASNLNVRNGLTKFADTLEFGGRLLKATTISQDGYPFQIKEIDSTSTVLEISQTAFSPLVNLSSTPSTQTFTSVASTKIHSIKIRVTATSGSSITLSIINSSGATLYTGTQNFGALFDSWQTFNLNSNVVQAVGDMYTLSVTGTSGTTWYYSAGNPYAGGQSSVNANRDFAFETIVFTDVPVLHVTNKRVGIGNTNPSTALDVTGTLKTTQFQLTTGANLNKILLSDINGFGTWTNISSLAITSLNTAYNYGGNGSGRIINADDGPVEIEGSDGLLVRKIGSASTPQLISGAGERMFYCPEIKAFRCGEVTGNNWNKDSLGENSAAFGLDTRATGTQSFASGTNSRAVGSSSFAIGSGHALGSNSFAQGGGSVASGISAASFGFGSKALGTYSFATSKNTEAAGGSSSTFGNETRSNGFASTVVGVYNDTVIATQASFETSLTPLFIVGNGSSTLRKNAMLVRKDGRVGIGTSLPASQLHVADSSVVFTGPTQVSFYPTTLQTPVSGAGRRMMWFVPRGAFRAGAVTGNHWNTDSIGLYSTALGLNTIAKGNYTFASGDSSRAEGWYSAAIGKQCLASGSSSFTTGEDNQSIGNYSMSTGRYNRATGAMSTAAGFDNTSAAFASFSVGVYNDPIVSAETSQTLTSPLFIVGNGTSVNPSNAMVVRGDGRVGIGTNSPLNQLELSTNSAAKPTSSSWIISSDARLKTVDGNYNKGLADILKLKTVSYHYKEGNARKLPTDEQGYGFIAQELQEIFPEAVKENEDGYLSVDMHPVLVAYINAFKDQQAQMDILKSSITILQKEIQELKSKAEQK